MSHPDCSEFYSSETHVVPVGLSKCINAVLRRSFCSVCSDLEGSGLAASCWLHSCRQICGDAAHTNLYSLLPLDVVSLRWLCKDSGVALHVFCGYRINLGSLCDTHSLNFN